MTSLRAQAGELVELPSAVAQLLRRQVQHRQLQVRERRVLRIDEMPPALERARASADEQRRQRTVRMAVAVADSSSIKNHHMVEQRSVTVRGVSQLLQVVGEQLHVVLLNLHALRHLRGARLT